MALKAKGFNFNVVEIADIYKEKLTHAYENKTSQQIVQQQWISSQQQSILSQWKLQTLCRACVYFGTNQAGTSDFV